MECLQQCLLVSLLPSFEDRFLVLSQLITDTSALICNLFGDTSETNDQTIESIPTLLCQRIEVRQLKKERLQFRAQKTQCKFHGLLSRRELEQEYRLCFRSRPHFERRFDNYAERAKRTTIEFGQIIAGHILDHTPTTFDYRPIRLDDFKADEEVADRSL